MITSAPAHGVLTLLARVVSCTAENRVALPPIFGKLNRPKVGFHFRPII
jgi:hypothetical protein